MDKVEVIASFDWLKEDEIIGTLGHESQRGTDVYSFEYNQNWLRNHPSLNLGGELQQFPSL